MGLRVVLNMARKTIRNESWKAVQPLRPTVTPPVKGGRPRVDDRAVLNCILFVHPSLLQRRPLCIPISPARPQLVGFFTSAGGLRLQTPGPVSGVFSAISALFLCPLRTCRAPSPQGDVPKKLAPRPTQGTHSNGALHAPLFMQPWHMASTHLPPIGSISRHRVTTTVPGDCSTPSL